MVLRMERLALAKVLVCTAWLAMVAPEASAAGLFAGLAGSWRGEGSMGWSTGETERVRCTATYEVMNEGNTLIQNMTCATDSTRLIIKSEISYNPAAGAITGTWAETSYGIRGYVTGRASTGTIQAQVKSADNRFNARVDVTTNGASQQVMIRPRNLEVTEVSVQLRRTS